MSYNPVSFTNVNGNEQVHFPVNGGKFVEMRERYSVAHELVTWLSTLPNFFDLKNHSAGDSGERQYLDRTYIDETRILRQVLRRCLHLCLISDTEDYASLGAGVDSALQTPVDLPVELIRHPHNTSLTRIRESVNELYESCRVLTETQKIDLRSWSGLGCRLRREIDKMETATLFSSLSPWNILRHRLPELCRLSESACAHDTADDICSALSSLADCTDQLSFVSLWLNHDRPLKMTLPIFTHVHALAREIISTLEKMALKAADDGGRIYEVLDSASYAMGMELNKVFNHELVGLAASHHPSAIYTKVENSHGLLRDCFQQTIVTLAQVFDPTFDGSKIFDSLSTKLQQSLRLRDELWAISELIRRAERDLKPLAPLVARLHSFQSGAMRHLMYKDWESFERFIAEISAARGAAELGPVLHRFATYLDALFNQINMRVVLAEHPFTYPPVD